MCMDRKEEKVLPSIVMTDRDWRRLKRLVECAAALYYPVSDLLEREVARAIVYPVDNIPSNIVTINSRVTFHTGCADSTRSKFLVFPERYTPNGHCVSVTSPLGAALIGMRSGSSLHYRSLEGDPRYVVVQDVAYQPQAARRKRLLQDMQEMDSVDALFEQRTW